MQFAIALITALITLTPDAETLDARIRALAVSPVAVQTAELQALGASAPPHEVTSAVFRLLDDDPAFPKGSVARERAVLMLALTPEEVGERRFAELLDALGWASTDVRNACSRAAWGVALSEPPKTQRLLDASFKVDSVMYVKGAVELVADDVRYTLDADALRALIVDPHTARPNLAAATAQEYWDEYKATMAHQVAAYPELAADERRTRFVMATEQVEELRLPAVAALLRGADAVEHMRWLEARVERNPELTMLAVGGMWRQAVSDGAHNVVATFSPETRREWFGTFRRVLFLEPSLRSPEVGESGALVLGIVMKRYSDIAEEASGALRELSLRHTDDGVRRYAADTLARHGFERRK